jgi:tRNA A-37 threonylcarbamoyl transferase component Bud32
MASERLAEGTLLGGRYEILEIVGKGGMGTVYRARDARLDITVAVKEMTERDGGAEERESAIRQFEREARLLAQLSHPNLPRVTDYFVEGDRWYLIMEFVQGTTLEAHLQEAAGAPLPLLDTLNRAVQVADVLAYLHGQDPPIVFRDIKPANIMVQEDGLIKLIDFGIARRFHADATKDTLLYGSPGYSPPEQYGRAQTDPRSDIYALGATLHHLVTGRDPAPAPFKFPSIRSLDPNLPPALDNFIRRCVEMDIERRCQSAEEARDTLAQIRAAVALSPPPPPPQAGTQEETAPGKPSGPHVISSRVRAAEQARAIRRIAAALVLLLLAVTIGAVAYHLRPAAPARRNAPSGAALAGDADRKGDTFPAALPGILKINTAPDARIYLDRQEIGPGPSQTLGKVLPGPHVIQVVPPAGSDSVEALKQFELQPGETREVSVPLAALSTESAPGGAPGATLQPVQAQWIEAATPERAGLLMPVTARITGCAGKNGMIVAFFYAEDHATALKPSRPDSPYQNADGQLSCSQTFQATADPVDLTLNLFLPAPAFPDSIRKKTFACQVVVYVEGRKIGQSEMIPLAWSRS